MRKIIYYVTASLDGFIARPNGSVDWLPEFDGEDFGYADFFESIGTVVLGRKTYVQVLSFGEDVRLELKGTKAFDQGLVRLDYCVSER